MSDLLRNALGYCKHNQRTLVEKPRLGSGEDGSVWKTCEGTALKALERRKNYAIELECYRRLSDAGINEIRGFAVPELEGHSDEFQVIEMSIVQPPYLLDFGKAHLDSLPDFFEDEEREETWRLQRIELFGEDWPLVRSAIYVLEKYGIYYLDAKPANIRLADDVG